MRQSLKQLREKYIRGDAIDNELQAFDGSADDGLRPDIRNSWLRCRMAQVQPQTPTAPKVLAGADLERRRSLSQIYRAGKPLLSALGSSLGGDHSVVLLIDLDHLLLEIIGGRRGLRAAEAVGAVAGSRWLERDAGTDALSLSMNLARATTVTDHEHYCEIGHGWTGAAVPIFSDGGGRKMLGALGVYVCGIVQPRAVLQACCGLGPLIEEQLRSLDTSRRLRTLEAWGHYRSRFPSDCVLAVDEYGEIFGGQRGYAFSAGDFLHLRSEAQKNFNAGRIGVELNASLQDRGGSPLDARCVPVFDHQEISGFVAVIPSTSLQTTHVRNATWKASYAFEDIVGRSPLLARCMADAKSYASSALPVLITGETGTGKELFAHAIHRASYRASRPFVALNCASLPDELLCAELFGHVDGAFTGALRGGKIGKLELAQGGTVFLDEVESMSPSMQASMLRVLEEESFSRLGAATRTPLDVRFISATNVDLCDRDSPVLFRQDLYYRLAALTVELPSLRDRKDDIEPLVRHLAPALAARMSDADLNRLRNFCWPGNIRQLKNILRRAELRGIEGSPNGSILDDEVCAIPCASTRCASLYGERENDRSQATSLEPQSDQVSGTLAALHACGWNITLAARTLGVHRVTLSRRLRKMKLQKVFSEQN